METETTLQLIKPVKLGQLEIAELKLSEPTAGQLVKAGKAGTPMEQLVMLIHLNAKVPMGAVEQLIQRDVEAAADFLGSFGAASPTTSETSSPS